MLALTNNTPSSNTPSRSITRNCHCCCQASTWHRSNDVSVIDRVNANERRRCGWLVVERKLRTTCSSFMKVASATGRRSFSATTTDGRLPIDNNDTERDLHRLTIGRKNWLFIGSSPAGSVAATMCTLVASATRHDLDIWAYLDDVLRRLSGGESDVASLLPDQWRATHPDSIRTYRQTEQAYRTARTKSRRRQLAAKR